jgi:hypothetical protein
MTDHDPREPDDIPAAELPPVPPSDEPVDTPVDTSVDKPDPQPATDATSLPPPASTPPDTGGGPSSGPRVAAWVGAAALVLAAFFGGRAIGHDGHDGPPRGDRHESGPPAGWQDGDHRPPMPPERGVERGEDG